MVPYVHKVIDPTANPFTQTQEQCNPFKQGKEHPLGKQLKLQGVQNFAARNRVL